MQKEETKVSIIIPVYNAEQYLDMCLNSVIKQTEKNIEILCIDDCSTDDSLKKIEYYAQKDKRLHVIKNNLHSGQAYSRNIGLDIAKGEFILFVDADDYIEREMVEKMYNATVAEKLDLLFCNVEVDEQKDDGRLSVIRQYRTTSYQNDTGLYLFQRMVENREMFGSVWGVIYRKAFLKEYQISFRKGILHEDIPFIFKAIILSGRAGCMSDIYYHYIQRNGSTMHSDNLIKRLEGLFIAYIDMLNFWEGQQEKVYEISRSICRYIEIYRMFMISLYNQISLEEIKNPVLLYLSSIGFFDVKEGKLDILIEEKSLKTIKSSGNVVIYGAGAVAKKVLNYLNKKNIHVDAFMVTNVEENRKEIDGIQVYDKKEIKNMSKDSVFVIGVSQRYRDEIYNDLTNIVDQKRIIDIHMVDY